MEWGRGLSRGTRAEPSAPHVRFTSDSDRIGASQRTVATCQSRPNAPQQIASHPNTFSISVSSKMGACAGKAEESIRSRLGRYSCFDLNAWKTTMRDAKLDLLRHKRMRTDNGRSPRWREQAAPAGGAVSCRL